MTRAQSPASWMDDAACVEIGGDTWFPESGASDVGAAARRVCRSCPVVAECLEHALTTGEVWGVWGGLLAHERCLLLEHRGRVA